MALNTVFCIFAIYLFVNIDAHSALQSVLFEGEYSFIDLSYAFDNNTIYWPNTQNFVFTKKIENSGQGGYSANEFAAGEHGGTHIDAPYHFSASGQQVGDIPLDKLILPLIIVDVSSITNDDPNFVLYKQHLDYILDNNMGKPCLMIFKFGWSKYINDKKKYLGRDEFTQTLNFPGLSKEIAEWIVSFKNIVGVGVDVASVDPGSSTDFPVHKIFSQAGIYNIENVNMMTTIPSNKCIALALPMKIAQGTGAPIRLVAVCPTTI